MSLINKISFCNQFVVDFYKNSLKKHKVPLVITGLLGSAGYVSNKLKLDYLIHKNVSPILYFWGEYLGVISTLGLSRWQFSKRVIAQTVNPIVNSVGLMVKSIADGFFSGCCAPQRHVSFISNGEKRILINQLEESYQRLIDRIDDIKQEIELAKEKVESIKQRAQQYPDELSAAEVRLKDLHQQYHRSHKWEVLVS